MTFKKEKKNEMNNNKLAQWFLRVGGERSSLQMDSSRTYTELVELFCITTVIVDTKFCTFVQTNRNIYHKE